MKERKPIWSVAKALLLLLLVNILAAYIYMRFDLTEDRRYTLSQPTLDLLSRIEQPVVVDVLLDGDLPAEFLKLRSETRILLQSFEASNPLLKFNFVDPLEGDAPPAETIAGLQQLGLTPANVTVAEQGRSTQDIVFPWAMVNSGEKTVKVALLKNKLGANSSERINNSVQNLEYAFADALAKLQLKEKKRVAIIRGHGELEDIYLADFLSAIQDYYELGTVHLDSAQLESQRLSEELNSYDMALVAKPTLPFTESQKYLLDQYMVQGGRSLWLLDPVAMELDSMMNAEGSAMAAGRNLNLGDLFFRYGVRLNTDLVKDLYFTQIVIASGEGGDSQYNPFPWYYHPMVFPSGNHPVSTNLEALRFQFTSSLDTLDNDYNKTILLHSSPLSRAEAVPRLIDFSKLGQAPDRTEFVPGRLPLAILVEGDFISAYANRVKPIALENPVQKGPPNKMVVIADGDLIKNQLRNGRPLELGYDKWTNNYYGNKEFLINCVNYLLDDTGLINIRARAVNIPMLDQEKISGQRIKWQLLNIAMPVLLTLSFGLLFYLRRKKKYGV